MYEMEEIKEKVILVGVETGGDEPAESSLDELAELARTAGAEVAGRLIQSRESIHPGTYIGKGKLLELKECLDTALRHRVWILGGVEWSQELDSKTHVGPLLIFYDSVIL